MSYEGDDFRKLFCLQEDRIEWLIERLDPLIEPIPIRSTETQTLWRTHRFPHKLVNSQQIVVESQNDVCSLFVNDGGYENFLDIIREFEWTRAK